ncbi:ABC transporter permease [Streptomyces sp. NPDC094034]|uniref:ABC transporter permease n=1 Tax=Streptomyces sp. NPDC094034 TaxID=3155309 RepID=UPI0033297841
MIITVYLVVPMLIVIPASFTSGSFLQVPPNGFSWRWYQAVFEGDNWTDAFASSVRVSATAATAATIVGALAVLGLSRVRRFGRVLRPLFFLPMVLPYIVFALGLGQMAIPLGLDGSLWPLMAGQAVLCLPIAFLTVAGGMSKIDPAYARAASSMGANWWRTVWKVELPLLRRNIVTGWLLAFAFGFDEVVLALFLSPPGQETLPAKLYTEASQNVSPLLASVSGLVVALTVLVALVVLVARNASAGRTRTSHSTRFVAAGVQTEPAADCSPEPAGPKENA